MLKLTSQYIHLGLTVLTLAGVGACSTSAMKGSSHNSDGSNVAALSSGSGGSTDASGVAPASGTTGDAGSIFSGTGFSPLSAADLATAGCSIPQTVEALKKATSTQGTGSGWGSGSGSSSGWGAGKIGSGWGAGKGSGAGDCPAGNGAGSGGNDAGTGASEPLPNGAKLWGGSSGKTATCSEGGFTVSMCQWAQSAKTNEKPVYVITLTTKSGAKFAQPFGKAVDAATKTACDAAALQIGKLLGGTATCGTYPAT